MHTKRTWNVGTVASRDELCEKLVGHSWTLCTGFRLGEWLFLNDSVGEGGAQEFGIVHEPTLVQHETWTVSWMKRGRPGDLIEYARSVEKYLDEFLADPTIAGPWPSGIERGQIQDDQTHGRCNFCA